jgi:hypothetical protein
VLVLAFVVRCRCLGLLARRADRVMDSDEAAAVREPLELHVGPIVEEIFQLGWPIGVVVVDRPDEHGAACCCCGVSFQASPASADWSAPSVDCRVLRDQVDTEVAGWSGGSGDEVSTVSGRVRWR